MGEIRTRDGERSDGEDADATRRYPFTPEELRSIAERPRHRAVLAALSVHGPLESTDLAVHVVARRRGVTVADVTAEQRRRARVSLLHGFVDRLATAGLVDRDGDQVSLGIEGADRVEALQRLDARPAADQQWNAVATILADDCRDHVVEQLAEATGPVSLSALARSLGGREAGHDPTPPADAVDRARIGLHHVHLPKLDAVDVVEYDPDARRATPGRLPGPYVAVMDPVYGDVSG